MWRRRVRPSIAALAMGLAAVSAVRAETLSEALAAAYRDNPRLLAQRANLRAADELVPQALSGFRPTITATGSAGKSRTNNQLAFFASKENRSPRSLSLNIEQPLFRGLRTFAQTRQAENTVRVERARLRAVEQRVLIDAVTAFMDVVRDQAVLRLNVNNEQVLRRQLQATQDRFEVGEVTRTDVAQARARLARAVADRVQAEGALEISRAAYKNVIGSAPGKLAQPEERIDMPGSLEEALDIAVNANPDVVAAAFAEKAARDGVDLVAGELLPTISVSGEISRNLDVSSRGSRSSSASITGQVTIPLYQAGSVTARVREAKQRVMQRRQELADARRQTIENTKTAWENLTTARARVRAFESEQRANEIALEGVKQEEAAGLRTVLDILDAEQELLDARVNLVRARRDVVVAGFQVWAAIGWLTSERLNLPVETYNVREHYEKVRLKPWGLGDPLPETEATIPARR